MARVPKASEQLVRRVAACLLFEDAFYESGEEIAKGIADLCKVVPVEEVAALAIRAREDFKLRHVPLFLLAQLDLRRAEKPGLLRATIERVVQRPDELAELLAIVAKVNAGSKRPLKKLISAQTKRGLAAAFRKFSRYQIEKWNRESAIKLRDCLFLAHPKPKDEEQAALWKDLANGTLGTADTWESALSAGKDKKETFERLISENKLGYMALLQNVRNMEQAGVDHGLVETALLDRAKGSRALPFRFVSAAKAAPRFADALSRAMLASLADEEKLPGTTCLLIDVSGSMDAVLSKRGTLTRWEAGAALGVLLREVCRDARVFTFSNTLVEVSNYRGLPMIDGVAKSQPHGGTMLAESLRQMYQKVPHLDRLIVITDEQSHDGIVAPPGPARKLYLVNVASYHPALDTSGGWTRVSGFSERLVDYIRWEEASETETA